ncbi:hypothetical protein BU23DRAFT_590685 [Bimuria novae-zelandiae CBS 107.79]|uniref:Ig-like domain-containing protein n=1 Tax=Bimuria novae-zelandiae CBS 107.79 TaxID=1447943 RepID=A0A6A5V639_9PLEO|nr:hypothetical protein BU23DRAFT_590685 [Bimuria novae-zelandiae CBS 107.79]
MHFPTVLSALAGALLAMPTAASPFDNPFAPLARRDVYVDNACTPLVYGATKIPFGTVCSTISSGTLTTVYTVNSGWTISDAHVQVGTAVPTKTAPGQFDYTIGNGACVVSGRTVTCKIPLKDEWRCCEKDLYIATHISATHPTYGSQTGWGSGPCYDTKGNCAKYWTFTQHCRCPVVYEYEPATTTKTVTITTTSEKVYTISFEPETKTETCTNPKPALTTPHVTTTKPIPADWTPPPGRK